MLPHEEDLKSRLVRVESRLVQLMLHMGLDPYDHRYAQDQPRELPAETMATIRS